MDADTHEQNTPRPRKRIEAGQALELPNSGRFVYGETFDAVVAERDALAARVAVLEGALRDTVRTCKAIADELRDEDEAKAAGALECALRFAALTA